MVDKLSRHLIEIILMLMVVKWRNYRNLLHCSSYIKKSKVSTASSHWCIYVHVLVWKLKITTGENEWMLFIDIVLLCRPLQGSHTPLFIYTLLKKILFVYQIQWILSKINKKFFFLQTFTSILKCYFFEVILHACIKCLF